MSKVSLYCTGLARLRVEGAGLLAMSRSGNSATLRDGADQSTMERYQCPHIGDLYRFFPVGKTEIGFPDIRGRGFSCGNPMARFFQYHGDQPTMARSFR